MSDIASAKHSSADLCMVLTGDLILDAEDPDHWLSGIAPAVGAADVAIGHLEVPHTLRGSELAGDVPAPAAAPEHLDALRRAGFSAVTLAGNHIADCGAEGIADTVERLEILGIAHCGAGSNLNAARAPAWLESGGRQIALLSYNCVGPEVAWANADRAGCNFLPIATAGGGPVSPAADLQLPQPKAFEQLRDDIASLRSRADVVVVALHKGVVHTPAVLAPYERPIAEAAVMAGADVVVSHHAHMLRGVEVVAGRPVFHGLGNGCVVTRALSPDQDHAVRAQWARRRQELFGFTPDPAYPLAPFHPDAVNAVLAVVLVREDGLIDFGVVPLFVEPPGRPVRAGKERDRFVIEYIDDIGTRAGLPSRQWRQRTEDYWACA